MLLVFSASVAGPAEGGVEAVHSGGTTPWRGVVSREQGLPQLATPNR